MAKAIAKEFVIVNTGLCAIYIGLDRLLPDEELTISEELLNAASIKLLISTGELTIKDNVEMNKTIKEEIQKRRKRDPLEGKTLKELEDGGEFA